jgi:hypothetical protein
MNQTTPYTLPANTILYVNKRRGTSIVGLRTCPPKDGQIGWLHNGSGKAIAYSWNNKDRCWKLVIKSKSRLDIKLSNLIRAIDEVIRELKANRQT